MVKPSPYGPTSGKVVITKPPTGPVPTQYNVTCVEKGGSTPFSFLVPVTDPTTGTGTKDVFGVKPSTTYVVTTTGLDSAGKPITLESLPSE